MNVGSLFAGIGGFDLGLERAGMRVAWQVEKDPFCRAILARHFPQAKRFEDVRDVGAENLAPVDVICGGFPCQDLSCAGRGAGLDGSRSGLWSEFARIICELRPRYVVVENVPALLTGKGKRWDRAPVGRVLGDLAEAGYDSEWARLSAREFGAPHLRKRVWIVAYPARDAQAGPASQSGAERKRARPGCSSGRAEPTSVDAKSKRERPGLPTRSTGAKRGRRSRDGSCAARALADTHEDRCRKGLCESAREEQPAGPGDPLGSGQQRTDPRRTFHDPDRRGHRTPKAEIRAGGNGVIDSGWWAVEPGLGRVAHGVPDRVDRLASLGNALVPQIAEWIGGRILEYERRGGVS